MILHVSDPPDTGALWENYVIAERMKYLHYKEIDTKLFFWRTTQQQEIDLIEETGKQLKAFECKWSKTAKAKFPLTFTANYPGTETNIISPAKYRTFYLLTVSYCNFATYE